ncbi:MAG: UDP-3-O-(3-hydroxymyristoyl)glucosamine N-acyltransferase [Brachymonas sp.]|nr:UDP-3-O-(3-hydroxymyristoyl)glucosamine N-acyltransferase [Brachymonas sp.]
MTTALGEIADFLEPFGAVLHGDRSRPIDAIAPLASATGNNISFLSGRQYADQLPSSQAACVLVPPWAEEAARQRGDCIVMPNPYAGFARLSQWWKQRHVPAVGYHIHPSASVHPQAAVAADAIIGPLCVVERGASVGPGSWLKSRVTLSEGCSVGARCIIHPGAVIGADGFGFANDNGEWVKIEQLGAVRIGDDVEIGANTCVDRGALQDTVIEDGVKLDNLIQIAHNVHLGKNVAIAANAGIAGSTTVEEGVTIGGAANIMGHITLAKGVHISATTFASRSIFKPGTYSGHFPFDDNASWEKNAATVRQLYRLRERIRALEQQLQKPTDS